MKTVGIAIDDWKLPIFEVHLKAAGYEYETHHISAAMIMLKVKAETIAEISAIVEKANKEAQKK